MSGGPARLEEYRTPRAETLTLTWSIVCLGGAASERLAGSTP
jgi:hypothetical protein